MAEHKIGTMDTRVQEKTFEGFIKLSIRGAITCIVILVFMALVNS